MSRRSELARIGLVVADHLDGLGYQGAGIVRQMARELALDPGADDGIPRCAGPGCDHDLAPDPARPGPPAIYCSKRCRDRAYRRGRSAA